MLILKYRKSLKLYFNEGVYLMELIHDNDLANVSGGMSTKEVELSSKDIEFISKSAVGASMGYLAGGIVGGILGAEQLRTYVLKNGEKSNSILGAIINKTIGVGCSIIGGVVGFAVVAATCDI